MTARLELTPERYAEFREEFFLAGTNLQIQELEFFLREQQKKSPDEAIEVLVHFNRLPQVSITVPPTREVDYQSVRDLIRESGIEDRWTDFDFEMSYLRRLHDKLWMQTHDAQGRPIGDHSD